MRGRYVLAPEAAFDLVEIWRYIKKQSSIEIADRVEAVIRDRIVFLAGNPGAGHWRKNLTDKGGEVLPGLLLSDRLSTRHETFAGGFNSARASRRGTNPQRSSVSAASLPVLAPVGGPSGSGSGDKFGSGIAGVSTTSITPSGSGVV
jgi:plasmid stabilization system protein ParE